MRRLVLLQMLAVAAACGDDPSLRIEVEQPANEDYRRLVAKTTVTVYESELDTLTCAQIEFGDVTDDLLRGAAVAQQTVYADGRTDGTLDDISRLGKKVVVARLYSATDVLVAAGCAEQGDLDGETRVIVKTTIAATVAVDTTDVDDIYGKQITIVDPLGESLVGREVRWRLFAPAGAAPQSAADVTVDPDDPTIWDSATPACTDNRGIASMRLVPPSKVSGFAARFRVSWPATPIDLISGYVRPGFGIRPFGNLTPALAPTSTNRCAIRTLGARRVVCADATVSNARQFEVVPGPLKTHLVNELAPSAGFTPRPTGVYAVDEPAGKEVYALLANGEVKNAFGGTSLMMTNCNACTIDDFRVAPACGDAPAQIYAHSTTGPAIRTIGVHGGLSGMMVSGVNGVFPLPSDIDLGSVSLSLNNVGCVTTINAAGVEKDVQILVVDLAGADGAVTRGLFPCGQNRICSVTLPFPGAAVTFVKAGTATKPEMQMIGTAFDIAGAELVGWVLRPTFDGNTFLLIDRQRIVAAAPPSSLLVGKLDNDDEPDLVWTMRGARSSILQVSYAHAIEDGSRLSALTSVSVSIDELLIGDLTGDGVDDLVGVGTTNNGSGFVVSPQYVDGPPVLDRTTESTCGP